MKRWLVSLVLLAAPQLCEANHGQYGKWHFDQQNQRHVIKYTYRNNQGGISAQLCFYHKNDPNRNGFYYWIKEGSNQYWGKCVRPGSPQFDPRQMKWSRRNAQNNGWIFLPGGECPPPPDAAGLPNAEIAGIPLPPP